MPATRKRPRPSSPEPGPAQRRRSKKQKKHNGEAVVATEGDKSTTKNKVSAGPETHRTRRKSVAGASGTAIGDIEGSFTIIARCPRPAKIIHHATASPSRTKADSKREIKLELEEDMKASASTRSRRKSTPSPRMATMAQPRYYHSSHTDSKPLPKEVHPPQYPDDESSAIAGPKAITNSDLFISMEPDAGKKSRQVRVSSEVAQNRVQEWRNSTAMSASTLTPESF